MVCRHVCECRVNIGESNMIQKTDKVKWAKKNPVDVACGFLSNTLSMTYSHMLNAHYHRRMRVSLPSSVWDRVVPRSYYHQGEGGGSRADIPA